MEAQERWQPDGAEQQWSDSFYVGGPRFYARVGRRPNDPAPPGVVEGALGVWLPDGRFAIAFAREEPGDAIAAGAVRMECVEPGWSWRIAVDGTGIVLPRPEALAERGAGSPCRIAGELRFTGWVPPFSFQSGLAAGVAAHHYEQPGSVSGVLTVDGDRLPVVGPGMRDHSWGVRDWQSVAWWKWTGVLADPDHFVLLNEVGTPGGGSTAGGCVMLGGELAPVAAGSIDGGQDAFVARATDERGREVSFEGGAIGVAPLRQRRDGKVTYVNEGLTRLRWDGREGLGLSEWLVQGA